MDSCTVQHFCAHLISSKIHVFFLKTEVVPHNILCLEKIFVLKIFYGESHSRKMISIHNKNHIFRIVSKRICQFLDKLVHLMNLIAVVFPLVILVFGSCTCNGDLRIIQHGFFRITAVPLHRNCIYIIRFFCGVQAFDDLICQNLILCPAKWIFVLFLRHIFRRGKGVKSEIREDTSSSIEVCLIVMYCVSHISQILKYIWCTLAGGFLEDTLVRILSRSEIVKAHPCDGLKFCVGSSCSYRRHLIIS